MSGVRVLQNEAEALQASLDDAATLIGQQRQTISELREVLTHVDYLLNELADERTPANVEMTPAEAALVAFRKHTRKALKATGEA